MTWFKRLCAAALCLALFFSLCACGGDKSQIKGTINDFERACHDLDAEELLECIDPAISTPIQNGTSILSALSNPDFDQALEYLIPYLFSSNSVDTSVLDTPSIKVDGVNVTGTTAVAHSTVSVRVNGEKVRLEADIYLLRVEDASPAWRISSVSFV